MDRIRNEAIRAIVATAEQAAADRLDGLRSRVTPKRRGLMFLSMSHTVRFIIRMA